MRGKRLREGHGGQSIVREVEWTRRDGDDALKDSKSMEEVFVLHHPKSVRERIFSSLEGGSKLFSCAWVNERTVVTGTANNTILMWDTDTLKRFQLPPLPSRRPSPGDARGIHATEVNPAQSLLLTGGGNPNDAGVFGLPTLTPCLLLEGATDWVFCAQWVDSDRVITGARDGCLRLYDCTNADQAQRQWKDGIPQPWQHGENQENRQHGCYRQPLREVKSTPGISTSPHVRPQRIRDASIVRAQNMLLTIGSGNANLWDVHRLKEVGIGYPSEKKRELGAQIFVWTLPCTEETSCVTHCPLGYFAVGTRLCVSMIDPRMKPFVGRIPTHGSSARSLQFHGPLLSIGGGAATLTFYDIRKLNERLGPTVRKLSAGHVVRAFLLLSTKLKAQSRDTMFHELQQDPELHCSMAAFTHAYSPTGTQMFVGGGPLYCGYSGSYAATWS